MLGRGSYVFSHDQFQGKFRQVSSQNRISLTARTKNCTRTYNSSWRLSTSYILPGHKYSQRRRELMMWKIKGNPFGIYSSHLGHPGVWTCLCWASWERWLRKCGHVLAEKRQGVCIWFAGSLFLVEPRLGGTFFFLWISSPNFLPW